MTNVSPISSPFISKSIRPGVSRPTGLPSQLAPTQNRTDEVRLSGQAPEAAPQQDAPIRTDLVNQVRADIEAGLYSDEAIDERFDAIIPKILEDIRNL